MADDIKRDFTHSLTIWLTTSKGIEPPKSVPRQNRDGWYRNKAAEIADKVFRAYDVTVKLEFKKSYSSDS